jgi:hypothetical protein
MAKKHYAIFTFRDAGPIKSWNELRGVQMHNSREQPIAHATSERPPVHLIGSGDLVGDTKAALRRHDLDPDDLRSNGVLAYEAVLTASPEYFTEVDDYVERSQRCGAWALAQQDFVLKKYGERRVVSLVLHLDEQTPHMHVVVLPLDFKPDDHPRWSLVGRTIAGPGQFQLLQDDYGAAMAPLGLHRGEVASGTKHKPTRDYMMDLRVRIEDADAAKRAAQIHLDAALEASAEAKADREKARKEWLEAKARIQRVREALEAERQHLAEQAASMRRGVSLTFAFLKDMRDMPAKQMSPELTAMRDRAFGIATKVEQAKTLPSCAPAGAREEWARWHVELVR